MASVEDLRSGKIKIDYDKCGICGKEIRDVHTDLIIRLEGTAVHDDCYYNALGDEIERHPIYCPRLRGGLE